MNYEHNIIAIEKQNNLYKCINYTSWPFIITVKKHVCPQLVFDSFSLEVS